MVVIQKNNKDIIYENITLNAEKTSFDNTNNNIENPQEIIEYTNQLRSYQMVLQKTIITKIKDKIGSFKEKQF